MFKKLSYILLLMLGFSCGSDDESNEPKAQSITLSYARLGNQSIVPSATIATADHIYLGFNQAMLANSSNFELLSDQKSIPFEVVLANGNKEIQLNLGEDLPEGYQYILNIKNTLQAQSGQRFTGQTINFRTRAENNYLQSLRVEDVVLNAALLNKEFPLQKPISLQFAYAVDENRLKQSIAFQPSVAFTLTKVDDQNYVINLTNPLAYWQRYSLSLSDQIGTEQRPFEASSYALFTTVDANPKFPLLSDEQLLDKVQRQTFKYFWEFGHPISGMARERNTSGDLVTTGGSGFGLMAMVVALERNWITREETVQRWDKMVTFLEQADRFHGAWPHWLNGQTGHVIPFSSNDDGADLVETAFLVQGLLTVRSVLDATNTTEQQLIERITTLWEEVEWTWFQKNNEDVLYWHWSPNYGWQKNLAIRGFNETQIVYILAASSPTYSISKAVYDNGFARSGYMANNNDYYGIELPLGPSYGGPLFFAHYSYLGLDPRNLQDQYAHYWTQNKHHTQINYQYSLENPKQFVGYGPDFWGLTASDDNNGYSAHSPTNDSGVITPTAALSSFPYTPQESLNALKFFYYTIGDRLWGDYGFYDAINPTAEWTADSYLAIDQGPIICMIENYRTALLWSVFMRDNDVQNGLNKLQITF